MAFTDTTKSDEPFPLDQKSRYFNNKKCDENYGGQIHKIMKQRANSFYYMVYWIDTDVICGLFIYHGENATASSLNVNNTVNINATNMKYISLESSR
ncbi:hypothetical protein RhiirA4_489273 [Rhizophagus irregularis]|uniref:Uncharacterized protein n=1 Tax=Rhizophagus irregularis TaxID=588596 RepID=A0A2I1HUP6_9GLOM|nr:hypothetical protein RhiirA4_489273 [Rhizophagus irregularis]